MLCPEAGGRGRAALRFVALRPGRVIPREVSNRGFRFGHGMLGNDNFEVIHFAFQSYGFETYNALINPNNPLARAVLTAMVESGDYFFFALDSAQSPTAFRSEIEQLKPEDAEEEPSTHPRLKNHRSAI
jgi:hypothetical protein